MAKRLSKEEKESIIKLFTAGKTIIDISEKFKCSKLTVTRNLKKYLGEDKFKFFMDNKRSTKEPFRQNEEYDIGELNNQKDHVLPKRISSNKKSSVHNSTDREFFPTSGFMEIAPLNEEIDNAPRKDLSSISIADIQLPKTVYMIVDKKIELETRLLKNFPEWQFLSMEDLNRKVIQIYYDLKNAKRECNNEQKVIKVPNTNVFKIISPLLKSRGITRIVSEEQLIAL